MISGNLILSLNHRFDAFCVLICVIHLLFILLNLFYVKYFD